MLLHSPFSHKKMLFEEGKSYLEDIGLSLCSINSPHLLMSTIERTIDKMPLVRVI